MAIATAEISAAPVKTMPRPRTALSFSFGMNMITTAPSRGRKVVIVIAEFSQVMVRSLSCDLDEDDGQRDDADEEPGGIPLDVARLDELQ